jgi:DNA-binding NtrC family response regulator
LIVCSRSADCRIIEEATHSCMLEAVSCSSLEDAQTLMAKPEVSLILCDDVLEAGSYQDLLEAVPRAGRKIPIVVIMSEANHDETYRAAMAKGAFDVIVSPCARQDVQWVVIRAMDLTQLPRASQRT